MYVYICIYIYIYIYVCPTQLSCVYVVCVVCVVCRMCVVCVVCIVCVVCVVCVVCRMFVVCVVCVVCVVVSMMPCPTLLVQRYRLLYALFVVSGITTICYMIRRVRRRHCVRRVARGEWLPPGGLLIFLALVIIFVRSCAALAFRFAGTPDRAMLTADGQIPSCSRTRHLRRRPGIQSPGPQHRLLTAPGPHGGDFSSCRGSAYYSNTKDTI